MSRGYNEWSEDLESTLIAIEVAKGESLHRLMKLRDDALRAMEKDGRAKKYE